MAACPIEDFKADGGSVMFKILLGTWALAGLLTSGLLTAVAQNPLPGPEDEDAKRQSQNDDAESDGPASDKGDTTQREQAAGLDENKRETGAGGAGDDESSDDQPPREDAGRNEPEHVTGTVGEGTPNDLGIQFRMNSSGRLAVSSVTNRQDEEGLREGDVIVSAGGRTFETEPALREFLTREAAQDRIPIVVMRDGRELSVAWNRESEDDTPSFGNLPENRREATAPQASIGAVVVDTRFGPRIAEIVPGSPAAEAGLQPGDFILAMNGQRPLNSARLTADVGRSPLNESINLQVSRDGQTLRIQTRPQPREIVYDRNRMSDEAFASGQPRTGPLMRGRIMPRMREQTAARPDFDTAQRIQELEGRVNSLQRDLEQLSHKLNAVLGNDPGHDAESAPSQDSKHGTEGAHNH
jgi:hypothetical protein